MASLTDFFMHPTVIMLILGVSVLLCAISVSALLLVRHRHPKRSIASQLQQLRRVPFLASLDAAKLAQIAKVVRELRVPADVYVIREQRAGEAMYILVSGQLHILKHGAYDETLLQVVGPGDVIGEMALLNDARRIASARAVTPCVLLQIDRDDFFGLLSGHPELEATVWTACESHSIELAAADHARTRGMSVPERRAWIATRKSEYPEAGKTVRSSVTGYLAVVTGSVEIEGALYQSPTLVRVTPDSEVRVLEHARLSWLSDATEAAQIS